jgi:alkanesulfonate monooxygenase SsuD/methylene tetrahydromethanopterin reductase-like flavin-dependent oxidoreductase (luciferase family)
MKLGRLGVWYGTDKLDGSQLRDFVRTVENNGYSTLWYPESRGYESMSLAAWLLSSSEKLVVGSSIANIYARDSFTAQRAMVSLNALYGDRFVLGLGVSHIPMVEGLRGHRYEKPLAAMGAYLDGIKQVRARRRTAAGRGRSTWTEDVNAERCQVAWRCPIQRYAEAYGSGRRDPRAFEVARGGAEGNARDRSREGAGARAQGTVALHGAAELPQQLAAPGLHRG